MLAAAYVESPPTKGTAAAAQDLVRDLQGLLAAAGTSVSAAAKPVAPFKPAPGAPPQSQLLLSVSAEEAAAVKEAVRRAAGPCSRGILRHLASVVAAVKAGGIKVQRFLRSGRPNFITNNFDVRWYSATQIHI